MEIRIEFFKTWATGFALLLALALVWYGVPGLATWGKYALGIVFVVIVAWLALNTKRLLAKLESE